MRVSDAACLRANVQRHLRGDHEYVSGDVLHRRRMYDNARGICILVSIRDRVTSITFAKHESNVIKTQLNLSATIA